MEMENTTAYISFQCVALNVHILSKYYADVWSVSHVSLQVSLTSSVLNQSILFIIL